MLAACAPTRGLRALDLGCGEGWLARALAAAGADVTGVDGSGPLIAAATAAGGARFRLASYADLVAAGTIEPGPFDLVACNFALLDEELGPLLRAVRGRVASHGRFIIQTVHPFTAAGEAGYVDGWREERFGSFGAGFSAPMPWYYRTVATWWRTLAETGWTVAEVREPRADDGDLLSIILMCRAAG